MDETFAENEASAQEEAFNDAAPIEGPMNDGPTVEKASQRYVGRWNRLVSSTNWEKGAIIAAWRNDLVVAGAEAGSYSDEAWCRRVGGVSPQHVGRLRRVHERFGETRGQYAHLYWSHFQAAVEWPDAEMWLEGAVQNRWSVSRMRQQRWEALGAPPALMPRDEDIVHCEMDEDVVVSDTPALPDTIAGSVDFVQDVGGHGASHSAGDASDAAFAAELPVETMPAAPLRPFENLAPLPADLNEAFEAFKLAILHHRLSGWQEVSCENVLAALDALKQLALAPRE